MSAAFGAGDYARLRIAAEASPRRRAHLELHAQGADDPLQRFLIGMLAGSYVRAHRHVQAHKLELTVGLLGACDLLFFDERGLVRERHPLRADDRGASLVQIPPNTWHSLTVPEGYAVLLEVKQGPYDPASDKDFAAWAPLEGEPAAVRCAEWLRTARPGERWIG